MASTTVAQLAAELNRSAAALLEQLQSAGVKKASTADTLTDADKERLLDHLRARGQLAHLTREPSDGPIGRLIREMLTGHHALPDGRTSQSTFGLLFAADRLDHLQREVEPRLAAGVTVVSDRWYHSSLAYQGTGADHDWIATLNARANALKTASM